MLPRFAWFVHNNLVFNQLRLPTRCSLNTFRFSSADKTEGPAMKKDLRDPTTASILIIGDEILKGQVKDVNTYFLTQNLHDLGVKVERVVVVPDKIDVVSNELQSLVKKSTYVVTTGGIGPTHDDVTFEAVAGAFGDELVLNEEILSTIKHFFKTEDPTEGMKKLATIPKSAKLNYSPRNTDFQYPLVSVQNVYIFPGVPELLRKLFNNVGKHIFKNDEMKRMTRHLYATQTEVFFASKLSAIAKKYADDGVVIGSYPAWNNNYYKVCLTIEAASEVVLEQVSSDIRDEIPLNSTFDPRPFSDSMLKVQDLLSRSKDATFRECLKSAIDTIEECFERYNPEEVIVAFNGGKDCIVILHLAFAYLKEKNLIGGSKKLQALYISDDEPFQEVAEYIEASRQNYDLDIVQVSRPMKAGLQAMLEARPKIKAAILGTRNGDPNSASLEKFSPTDCDWPVLMRVNPILSWSYGDVWRFIRELNLLYPALYDRGYTSLGHRRNTSPNPSLKVTEADGTITYKPAYLLEDGKLERCGRK